MESMPGVLKSLKIRAQLGNTAGVKGGGGLTPHTPTLPIERLKTT
jgi:hypothetical protein